MTGENKKAARYSLALFAQQLRGGLLDNNPTLVQLLGTCPTLATTTSIDNAIGMGIAATLVLVFSNLFISLLRKLIPPQVRIAAYIVIISGFVSAIELLIKAFLPALDAALGVFIPLIVVNCIILARAEAFALKPRAAVGCRRACDGTGLHACTNNACRNTRASGAGRCLVFRYSVTQFRRH